MHDKYATIESRINTSSHHDMLRQWDSAPLNYIGWSNRIMDVFFNVRNPKMPKRSAKSTSLSKCAEVSKNR